ncbi:MAG: hypothetical protein OXF20_03830 [Gammaproteobacteria bacterium]|nr:hypothetical protein [Gammaproteobacteria bacterium]
MTVYVYDYWSAKGCAVIRYSRNRSKVGIDKLALPLASGLADQPRRGYGLRPRRNGQYRKQ